MAEIIGRRRELGVADEFLTWVHDGPSLLVLRGEAGIGKPALWEHVIARAETFPSASSPPVPTRPRRDAFGALADIVEPVMDDAADELAPPQRRALAIALLRDDPGDDPVDQRAVAAAMLGLVRILAARAPVLLAVDDAQWLDQPSAHVLGFATRRLADLRVGVLVAERTETGGPTVLPSRLGDGIPPERRREIDVGPMSVAALHTLLKSRLGRSFARPAVVRLSQVAGGDPLLALEIARGLPDGFLPTTPLPCRACSPKSSTHAWGLFRSPGPLRCWPPPPFARRISSGSRRRSPDRSTCASRVRIQVSDVATTDTSRPALVTVFGATRRRAAAVP